MLVGTQSAVAESVELLDGGERAYPRMLAAIARARRGVAVRIVIDGWPTAASRGASR